MTSASGVSARPSVLFERVSVDFGGRRVFDELDLFVGAGELVGLTGPSGSGKSVLCLVLAGVVAPSTGRIERAGTAAGQPPTTGLVLQSHGLVSGLSAEENVWLPLQVRGLDREDIAVRAAAALSAVGLSKHAARYVDDLSGGERQRVGIARALAGDPDILIADEPTSELDPDNRQRVLEILAAHAVRHVVVIASDDTEVLDRCRRVVMLAVSDASSSIAIR